MKTQSNLSQEKLIGPRHQDETGVAVGKDPIRGFRSRKIYDAEKEASLQYSG